MLGPNAPRQTALLNHVIPIRQGLAHVPAKPVVPVRASAIVVTTSEFNSYRSALSLEDTIAEELADFLEGRDAVLAKGLDVDSWVAHQHDVTMWRDGRCLALIQIRAGVDPLVTRFDSL